MNIFQRLFQKNEDKPKPTAVVVENPPAAAPLPEMLTINEISPEELPAFMEENPSAQVIDIRWAWEFGSGHIPGAVSVPMMELTERLDDISRENPVVVQCYHGISSLDVVGYLIHQGWDADKIHSLSGGIAGWMTTHGVDALEKDG